MVLKMKRRFKKIYVEITNRCNLKCSFCSKLDREIKEMSLEDFKTVISKIKPFTDYIYLHVKGEPLLHSRLDDILSICDKENIQVNITTNGTLLKDKLNILSSHASIRQINVSLHSENNFKDYFENIFDACDKLSEKIYISYRIWNLDELHLDEKSTTIVDKIINHYKLPTKVVDKLKKDKDTTISNNIFVNKDNLFTWPDSFSNYDLDGKCYGLNTHIGILVDGTIIPCCLDGNGQINLGNIFKNNLEDVLNSKKVLDMINGFKNGKSICQLCKNCNFRNRFIK